MSRIVAIALNTFREAIRNRILYFLLFFAAALIVSALAVAQVSLHEDARIVRDIGLGGISIFGIAIAVFVGVNLVYKEIDRKTVFTLLPKPLHRWEFVVGKYAGIVLTLAVQIVLMSLVLFAVLSLVQLDLEAGIVRAIVLSFIELTVITAIAIFFSTFTTPFLSGLFTVGLFVVGRSTVELRELGARLEGPLRYLLAGVVRVVPDLHIFYVSGAMLNGHRVSVHDQYVSWGYIGVAGLYGAAYVTIALVFASILFSRRDFV